MKKKVTARVISHNELVSGIFDLWIETELAKEAHAGQFIGVYTKDKSKLLPRPISICEVADDKKALRLVYRVAGAGTADISTLKADDSVDIIGILGNGYDFDGILKDKDPANTTIALLGGGIGIPPMLECAKELAAKGIKTTVIAGYRDSSLFLNHDLAKYAILEIATEDGSIGTKGNVLNVVDNSNLKPDVILSCGPLPMLRAIKNYAESETKNGHKVDAFISLEERMACGVGACLGCVVKTKEVDHHSHVNNARICTDGPVYNSVDVEI